MTDQTDSPSKTIHIRFSEAKGLHIKQSFDVLGEEAAAIKKMLENSFSTKLQLTHLHKPFLSFTDMNGEMHFFSMEIVLHVKIVNKAVSGQ